MSSSSSLRTRLTGSLVALAAALVGTVEARECGREQANTFRDGLVGYQWSLGLGEPVLPIVAEKEKAEVKKHARSTFHFHENQPAPVQQDNTRVVLQPLPKLAKPGERLKAFDENLGDVLATETDEETAADHPAPELASHVTHTTVTPKTALLVVECEEDADKQLVHDAYVRVPTLHNEVGFKLSGQSKYDYFAVQNGRVALRVTINKANGKRTVTATNLQGAKVVLRTNWFKHPQTKKTLPAVYGKVVKIPGSVVQGRGQISPCLDAREMCAAIQKAFHGKSATVHQQLMCAAKHESGWVPSVYQHEANKDGSMDAGLMQVNSVHWARVLKADGVDCSGRKWRDNAKCLALRDRLLEPDANLAAARDIYDKQGIGAWYGYSNYCSKDRYKKAAYACPVTAFPKDDETAKWLRR